MLLLYLGYKVEGGKGSVYRFLLTGYGFGSCLCYLKIHTIKFTANCVSKSNKYFFKKINTVGKRLVFHLPGVRRAHAGPVGFMFVRFNHRIHEKLESFSSSFLMESLQISGGGRKWPLHSPQRTGNVISYYYSDKLEG